MGGTTAWEVHCSGSWPTWMACVAKCWKRGWKPYREASFSCMLSCEGGKEKKSEEDKTRKLVRQGLKETQESGERELKTRRADDTERTKAKLRDSVAQTLVAGRWFAFTAGGTSETQWAKAPTRPSFLIGRKRRRCLERRWDRPSRCRKWSEAGVCVSTWCRSLRAKFLSPGGGGGEAAMLAPVSPSGVCVTSRRRFAWKVEKGGLGVETE